MKADREAKEHVVSTQKNKKGRQASRYYRQTNTQTNTPTWLYNIHTANNGTRKCVKNAEYIQYIYVQ